MIAYANVDVVAMIAAALAALLLWDTGRSYLRWRRWDRYRRLERAARRNTLRAGGRP